MSMFGRESTRYILLKHVKLELGMGCERLQRGEICVNSGSSNFRSDFLPLFDGSRQLWFLCPAQCAAKLTETEAQTLMRIDPLEDRYKAFKEGYGFENLEAGSKVFVTVNGTELPGVVMAVIPSFPSHKAKVQVDIQEHRITFKSPIPLDSLRPHWERNEMLRWGYKGCLEDNLRPHPFRVCAWSHCIPLPTPIPFVQGNTVVTVPLDSLRPRCERNEMPRWDFESYLEDKAWLHPIGDSQVWSNLPVGIIEESDSNVGFPFPSYNYVQNPRQSETVEQIALVKEQHSHEQTKTILKERSEQLTILDTNLACALKLIEEKENELEQMSDALHALKGTVTEEEEQHREKTKEELNELQRKLNCALKAKEEAEKRLQRCLEENEELETTLTTAQNLSVKMKQEKEDECEWILNRDEIHLTEDKLGSGTFGTVYKGMFRGTQVAVKHVSVKPKFTEYNIDNFRREMKMASRCRHPCMLQFIGATNDDKSPFLVTELLNTSLKAVLQERALDPIEIRTIALDVAKALNYLHLNRPHPIVHRDISSGNVLLWKHGDSWRGKVSDYGSAVMMIYARTGSGGALPYLAPEMKNQSFSTKCDVYSYGVLLLEMCLRKEPSCLDNRNELVCLVEEADLRKLMRGCLQENHKQRPSMEEVLAVLATASELMGSN